MRLKNMEALLIHELKDLYSAETQLTKALPKMAKNAQADGLREAFEEHLAVTEKQKERIEKIFKQMDSSPRGQKCRAMEGLIEEGEEIMNEEGEPEVKDAAMIAAAQRIEHYEIAGYGSACAFAKLLDMDEVAGLLEESLAEEKETDQQLNELAMKAINPAAARNV